LYPSVRPWPPQLAAESEKAKLAATKESVESGLADASGRVQQLEGELRTLRDELAEGRAALSHELVERVAMVDKTAEAHAAEVARLEGRISEGEAALRAREQQVKGATEREVRQWLGWCHQCQVALG